MPYIWSMPSFGACTRWIALSLWLHAWLCLAAERELIRDPHFQQGFHLLDPKPGKRVVYGRLPGRSPGETQWDLAQWSSRHPLLTNQYFLTEAGLGASN